MSVQPNRTGAPGGVERSEPAAPVPDQKDWTWVLGRPCAECGFDAAGLHRDQLAARLAATTPRWQAALRAADVGVRPSAQVWSTLEYACHVRDVHALFAQRGRLIRTVDDPEFANWDQDETARALRYWASDPAQVSTELISAAATAAAVFTDPTDADWQRTGRRSNGSSFTLETLGLYYLHDVEHHLHDVEHHLPDVGR